jgi:hypothetical protein
MSLYFGPEENMSYLVDAQQIIALGGGASC